MVASESNGNCQDNNDVQPVPVAAALAESPQPSLERQSSSNSGLNRVASRVGGFGTPPEAVNRDELVGRGMSHQQVDAVEVQRHQNELLQEYLKTWLVCMMCVICLALPASLGVLIWLMVAWVNARNGEARCDSPLIEWVSVLYVLKMYYFFLHPSMIRCVCGYNANQEPRPPPPRRVVVYNLFLALFDFTWSIVGLFIAGLSKNCGDVLPDLYKSTIAFATISIFITMFMLINTIGLQALAAYMMRNGMITGQNGAQAGTYEKQKVVQQGSAELGDITECAICLDEFKLDESKEIRQTFCKHAFHAKCLKGWLKVGRTCPLCRQDLCQGAQQSIGNPQLVPA